MKKFVKLKCKKCGHEWKYTGYKIKKYMEKGIYVYTTCPICKGNVLVKEEK